MSPVIPQRRSAQSNQSESRLRALGPAFGPLLSLSQRLLSSRGCLSRLGPSNTAEDDVLDMSLFMVLNLSYAARFVRNPLIGHPYPDGA